MDKKNGVIFHWGIYSVPAFDDVSSAKRRMIQNGSEWYVRRLLDNGNYRPISGFMETQNYHKKNYLGMNYNDFINLFTAENFDSNNWMKTVSSFGVSYVILTAKHHDGFCLWNTKTTNFNSMKACNKNLLKLFADSAKLYGLRFGIYYSLMEFDKGMTKTYIEKILKPQINELMEFSPDIWWFDGDWAIKTNYAKSAMVNIITKLIEKNKNVQINDRVCFDIYNKLSLQQKTNIYRVFGDRYIPTKKLNEEWEHINTIGLSWGYNKQQTLKDYKTGKELMELYKKVISKNGRFLINLGPKADGTLDNNELMALAEFTKLKINNQ